ncbi:MAG TPA: class I SAM-dependent DNA methyltransferase [Rubrivivax sp.]|nr:class I SAM-dependent DNA methyltransferase [Rubrivivax sp.]
MPLSWNEIKARAIAFAKDWADAGDERAQAQPFWIDFFAVFGLSPKRLASFEHAVKKHGGAQGYVDLFWPGMLIVEHKSRGRSLNRAFGQALDYFPGIAERDLPRHVVVTDFARLRLTDLVGGDEVEFPLADLHKHLRRFAFIAGYQVQQIKPQDPVNLKAAERMGRLHDALKASGYDGHALEVLLVRLLFCLFADDTGIFQPAQAFRAWVEERSAPGGSDLGPQLAALFQVLNTPEDQRSRALDEQLAAFPYVNGALFAEALPLAAFDAAMREHLLDACAIDWSAISPAIFGALFQSIMDAKARRNLGAHYTSEENILKLIGPLFLDELRAEFHKVKGNRNRLFEFHKKLRGLNLLDPACGCGNFLVISYRELRLLELEVLRAAYAGGQRTLDVHQLIALDVDQFHGIEIEEFPAQIAQVALWLIDHQMNLRVSEEFGQYFARIPLVAAPHIVHGNALRIDWAEVLPPERCAYVLGNPPFVGAKFMDDAQRADAQAVFVGVEGGGLLDFVAAWCVKALRYAKAGDGAGPRCAFVSTNSITQGEQVGVLWGWILGQGAKIHFAHRTFQWSNEARGVAAVHCVIVGFGLGEHAPKTIYEYDDIRGEPHARAAANINPYLVDAPDVVLARRSRPICDVPAIGIGNKPIDDGNYLFTTEERDAFVAAEPGARRFFRRWLGAEEFINGYERWCLWLGDASPGDLRGMPSVMQRIQAVKRFREASRSAPTRALAATPTRFHVENMPLGTSVVIAKVSSERREFVPMGFIDTETLCSDLLFVMPEAKPYHFGILTSTMHNAWVRSTCGRLESRYRYSAAIVYNNFPWPEAPSDAQRAAVEAAAQAVLDARAMFPDATLADLYDPLTMPPALLKAHHKLDAAVDAAYGKKPGAFKSDAERVAFLFERWQALASLLPAAPAKRPRRTAPAG